MSDEERTAPAVVPREDGTGDEQQGDLDGPTQGLGVCGVPCGGSSKAQPPADAPPHGAAPEDSVMS